MNQFALGDGVARWLVWGLAALVASCGQTSHRDDSQKAANAAGQRSNGTGASGAAASGSAASGGAAGLTLGGSLAVDTEAGSTGVAGTAHVAVPLLDTTLCDNDFVRVEQLPDTAPSFSGTFDGEPVDVFESADVAEPPTFQVFRFGPTHIENVGMQLYLPVGPYDSTLNVSAVDCGAYSELFLRLDDGNLRHYDLASAELHTVTNSVDGFSGLTRGSVFASWINDDGEQHVLQANFTLHAVMGDSGAQF